MRTTITAHIPKRKIEVIQAWQHTMFKDLKALFIKYQKQLTVVADTEQHYELWTNQGYRSKSFHVKRNKGIAFASIIIFPNHISFYFYPLFVSPEIEKTVEKLLKECKTGTYTFKLKCDDATKIPEIIRMLEEGWRVYKAKRLVA